MDYFKTHLWTPKWVNDCSKLDPNIRSSSSYNILCNALLKFIRPVERNIFTFTFHLHEHKFRHNFKDTLNPMCSCNIEAESTTHISCIKASISCLYLRTNIYTGYEHK